MTGAASRKRGHDAERAVAKWFREHGYPDARTTRAALGHDGAHAPGDVAAIPGLVIEVKDVAKSAWPTWCRQAEAEAGDRPWIVVRKVRGCADPGKWQVVPRTKWGTSLSSPREWLTTLGEYVAWWESDDDTDALRGLS